MITKSHQQDASSNDADDEPKVPTTAESAMRKRRKQQKLNSDDLNHTNEHTQKIEDEKQKNHIRNTLASAGKGLSYLLSLSFLSKIVTFLANTYIIRQLDPDTKGFIFKSELFAMTVIFLSSECFRRACLRSNVSGTEEDSNKQYLKIRTTALLSIPYGMITLLICYCIWGIYYLPKVDAKISPLILYSLATLIEIVAQPFYIVSMAQLAFGVRVSIEAAALFVKIFTSFVIVNIFDISNVLQYYGYSQIFYSSTILIGYLIDRIRAKNTKYEGLKFVWDWNLFGLSQSFLYQSLIKYILTEGEKHILILFQSQYNQGVFDLVFNLGSLAARLLFQYIEETSFSIWSKLSIIINSDDSKPSQDKQLAQEAVSTSAKVLILFLKMSTLLGCIFAFFGPAYAHTLVYLLYGNQWANHTEAPKILSIYCIYILFMSLNGITEAFIHALSARTEIIKLNFVMILFSVLYMSVCVTCLWIFNLGTISMIIANCFNMLMRISYSVYFIIGFYNKHQQHLNSNAKQILLDALPSKLVMLTLVTCLIVTKYVEIQFDIGSSALFSVRRIGHVVLGATFLAILVAVLLKYEKQFIAQFQRFRQGTLLSR
ncbi:hypothetical protein C9374_005053 [Naegleria lovaniensis]|uniref:Protein RFT1 homolog n=1 Tax=Naegleria lovaniensis TaxID=51637 RepID=A0AA88KK21_NAELO|nr:uncharacterized protein C9374_005053 [Naegleria lovaniensis]KAG2382473.1 hypothetical protein C9374_005053 [Naegleria lovaniensis]